MSDDDCIDLNLLLFCQRKQTVRLHRMLSAVDGDLSPIYFIPFQPLPHSFPILKRVLLATGVVLGGGGV